MFFTMEIQRVLCVINIISLMIFPCQNSMISMRQLGDRVIQLKVGKVRGVKVEFPDNVYKLKSVERFAGIQYVTLRGTSGKNLRFLPPSSYMPRWGNKVKDFTQFSPVCPQDEAGYLSHLPEGSSRKFMKIVELVKAQTENCLYLNIWSPKLGMYCVMIMFS